MDISNKTLEHIKSKFVGSKFSCLLQEIANCEDPELDCIRNLINVIVVSEDGFLLDDYCCPIEYCKKIVEQDSTIDVCKKIYSLADALDCAICSIDKESYDDPYSETGYSDKLIVKVVEKEKK